MILPSLPGEAAPLLLALAPAFTRPSGQRFLLLMAAAVLTTGRRTVANLLRTAGPLARGHKTSYQRVLSAAAWSGVRLGGALCGFILRHLVRDGVVTLVGDDTVESHPGRKVYGKARHRDPVRSSHAYTAWRYGHKWVVLAVLVRFPFAVRPWALPVLVDLYRSAEENRRRHRPHRTPAQLLCRLLRLVLLRFPGRRFVIVGDAGYGTHEVARFVRRYRGRLALVSKLHPGANLFAPPPRYRGRGRPRVKGRALPKPREAVAQRRHLRRRTVAWYGGGCRRVQVASGTGHWYKSGRGLVPLRWVFVRDRDGTHRDEYFFTTDPTLAATAVIGYYTGRWNIETTFEELRAPSAWRRRAAGAPTRSCAPPRACSGCTRPWPSCSTPSPKPSAAERGTGPAKRAAPSPTPWRPSAAGFGPNGFSHRPAAPQLSKNSPTNCATSSFQPSPRRRKLHQSS
jgi:hypothetical protein